jgi:hypothetical protein
MLRGGGGGEEGEIEAGYGWRVGWEGKGCAILREKAETLIPTPCPLHRVLPQALNISWYVMVNLTHTNDRRRSTAFNLY